MNNGLIYQNTDFSFNNGQNISTCTNKIMDIHSKINNIFNTNSLYYKIKVNIKMQNNEFNTIIIGKTNTKLVTIDGKIINIKDIIDINLI